MSKSNATKPTNFDLDDAGTIRALKSELNYWKIKYILLEKYGTKT